MIKLRTLKSGLAGAAALAALTLSGLSHGQSGIVATKENGRTIFVNNDAPAMAAPAQTEPSTRHLIYWSNTQHRWKPVPTPTRRAMRSARSAAAEVQALVAQTPMTPLPANTRSGPFAEFSAPDTRGLTAGHRITQAEVDAAIDTAAVKHHVDPNLVRSIIKVESNFNPHAVSRKGAMGLMQLMPSTARELNVTNPFDVAQNVDGGVRHFKGLMDTYNGDVSKSLAAYNAGAGAVSRHGGVPPYAETRDYVRRINKFYGQSNPFQAIADTQIHVNRDSAGRKIFTNE